MEKEKYNWCAQIMTKYGEAQKNSGCIHCPRRQQNNRWSAESLIKIIRSSKQGNIGIL